MYRGSEADKKQKLAYARIHKKTYSFCLYDTKNKEMIEFLSKIGNISSYLKDLIKKDMEWD